jgi:hypothetical protein
MDFSVKQQNLKGNSSRYLRCSFVILFLNQPARIHFVYMIFEIKPEDGGATFLRNVGNNLQDCKQQSVVAHLVKKLPGFY